jgi:toxin ParE1/3/4
MARAQYTPEARRDLKEIALWIGRRDRRPKVAAKIVREIKVRCDDFANAFAAGSDIGTPRPELGSGYRVFPHKRWVIIFRELAHGMEVMRIVDGARDFDRLFGD